MAGQVEVGRRYLHGKTRSPLTVRYIGPLPPTLTRGPGSNAERIGETSHDGPSRLDNWIGVEYDDPSKGKHSGTYEGRQVFKVRREGAGAFIRDKPGALIPGKTFVEALEERYGAIAGYVGDNPASIDTRPGETKEDGVALKPSSQLVLGSSGGAILVEAPNLDRVKRKMSQLESLKQIGFEDEHIIELGGNEDTKSILRVRVKGVTVLNLSNNLIPDGATLAEIVDCLPSLDTLVLRHSRMSSHSSTQAVPGLDALCRIKFLHLGDCDMFWQEVMDLSTSLEALETLHLDGTTSLKCLAPDPSPPATRAFGKLQSLSLAGCGINDWVDVITGLSGLPSLTTLNISQTPIQSVPRRLDSQPRLPRLTTLVWNDSAIESWADLDHIESWLDLKLTTLSFSRADPELDNQEAQANPTDPMAIPVSWDEARSTIIAKFGCLTMLNSTPVSATERRDAEKAYLVRVERLLAADESAQASDWGRFQELREKHGAPAAKPAAATQKATLRSKMMNLRIQMEGRETFNLSVLPASTTSSLRNKISRKLKVSPAEVYIWMAKPSDLYHTWQPGSAAPERLAHAARDGHDVGGPAEAVSAEDDPALAQWEKVSQIRNPDVKVGDWCEDGDVVIVDIGLPE